jgi:drug/metabolite transporter (DMT)-like permease
MIKKLPKNHIVAAIFFCLVDYQFYSRTNPSTASSLYLFVGFILLLLTTYSFVALILDCLGLYIERLRTSRKQLTICITCIGGLLIGLQSVGQLSPRDALVIFPLAIIFYVYYMYARKKMRPQPKLPTN